MVPEEGISSQRKSFWFWFFSFFIFWCSLLICFHIIWNKFVCYWELYEVEVKSEVAGGREDKLRMKKNGIQRTRKRNEI